MSSDFRMDANRLKRDHLRLKHMLDILLP